MKLQFIITAAMLLCLGVPAQARHIDFDGTLTVRA